MAGEKEDKDMKAGRVSQTVYRRSVLKQIQDNKRKRQFLSRDFKCDKTYLYKN